MAPWRRIHGGKSFGRSQAIITLALDDWESFDSWCLIHGVDHIWKLPSYRFGALVVNYLKSDKTPEGITDIDNALAQADLLPHPFMADEFHQVVKTISGILNSKIPEVTRIDNVIYDSRLTDVPIEEKKRQEARAAGKPFRVPEWWRGEQANYKVAKSMMKTLPKKLGPIKE